MSERLSGFSRLLFRETPAHRIRLVIHMNTDEVLNHSRHAARRIREAGASRKHLRGRAAVNHTLGDYLGEAFRFKIAPCAVLVPPALNQLRIVSELGHHNSRIHHLIHVSSI